jgi:hypothetical protein
MDKYVIAFLCNMYNGKLEETYAGPGFGKYHTMPYSDIDRAFKFNSFEEAKKFYENYKDELRATDVLNPCVKRICLTFLGRLDN